MKGLQRPDLSVGDGIYKSTMREKPGRIWACATANRFHRSPSIHAMPNRFWWRSPVIRTVRMKSAAFFARLDGGKTFEKVLYKDENTGGGDVLIDPTNPDIAYAALWESRQGPWENGAWNGTGGGIFKSTDNGKTWKQLNRGLPEKIVQANLAIAPSSPETCSRRSRRLVGSISFDRMTAAKPGPTPQMIRGRGRYRRRRSADPRFDPKNPEIVYSASTVCWKSIDGGKTWEACAARRAATIIKTFGSTRQSEHHSARQRSGCDHHGQWRPKWSTWYNQPTAQLYHVSADNAFPYRLCSGQQESGSVGIASRGNDGEITFREWHPVAAEEYGYVVADPLDPDIVYGGKLTRYDRRTGQAQKILPMPFRSPDFRMLRTQPVVFSPVDPHVLFFSGQHSMENKRRWTELATDQSRPDAQDLRDPGEHREISRRTTAQQSNGA